MSVDRRADGRGLAMRRSALIGASVFAACLLGIATRTPHTLAVFWPANALLLGVLLRDPKLSTPATWIFASFAYFFADAATGAPVATDVALNVCNVAGVACGFAMYQRFGRRFQPDPAWLQRVQSLALVAAVIVVASAGAGVAGGFVNVLHADGSWIDGWTRWFGGEFLNYVATMPAVLAAPGRRGLARLRRDFDLPDAVRRFAPAAASFVLCCALVWFVGGPGSIAFAMPALVVAALMTDVFVTSLSILASTMWWLVLAADGRTGLADPDTVTLSISVGVSFLALAPIAVAIVTGERQAALAALRHSAAHDDLTGALRRDEFFRRAQRLVETSASGYSTVLMMDLDHFKGLNDTLGHSAGDAALTRFAADVRAHLVDSHLFARLGGEEFAVFLLDTPESDAIAIADSIKIGQFDRATQHDAGHGVTVSIGVATGTEDLEVLVDAADRALYEAKHQGRNRVVTAPCR